MPLDFKQLPLGGTRGERIDTRRALLVAEALADLSRPRESDWQQPAHDLDYLCEVLEIPEQNDVPRKVRAAEMLKVWRHYPRQFLEFAFTYPPPWHTLVEPTRWDDVDRDEVVSYFQEQMDKRGAWPSIGALRSRFGRQSNHRPEADKMPGQDQLGVGA
jgi:hypothetical protein